MGFGFHVIIFSFQLVLALSSTVTTLCCPVIRFGITHLSYKNCSFANRIPVRPICHFDFSISINSNRGFLFFFFGHKTLKCESNSYRRENLKGKLELDFCFVFLSLALALLQHIRTRKNNSLRAHISQRSVKKRKEKEKVVVNGKSIEEWLAIVATAQARAGNYCNVGKGEFKQSKGREGKGVEKLRCVFFSFDRRR